jgi:hypothetical protein
MTSSSMVREVPFVPTSLTRHTGHGEVINEPCNCVGTFTAVVRFEIENTANSDRYCLKFHLCADPPVTLLVNSTVKGKARFLHPYV